MLYTAHFGAAVLGCYLVALVMLRSRWPASCPTIAILCWQGIGLAVGLSAIGIPISIGLAPYDEPPGTAFRILAEDLAGGRLPAELGVGHLALISVGLGIGVVLFWSTGASLRHAAKARQRQRELLALVGRADPAAPGALVLDHPSAAAYCVPGLRPRVVISVGALSLLPRDELAAVLSHEEAHAKERHDLVLLPFTALVRALPGVSWVVRAMAAVALLVEMRADDRARRQHTDASLAAALARFATAPSHATPAGMLGAADHDIVARVRRLRAPLGPTPLAAVAALVVSSGLATLPIALFIS
ncbi:M56 family metallopeptidase [Asanoa sp. NPDC050611]|uniref:M56 family metallopeptidase n=1 Tax=Asanoa sp. NPDC050611 TaxID=3157098 RepID=UPI0033CF7357